MSYGLPAVAAIAMSAWVSACASIDDAGKAEMRITPDDLASPKHVRFDVPAAYVLGLPGDHVPATLQARISTREIATAHLAPLGYCPRGFTGADAVFAPNGDRARAAFVVDCR